LSSIWQNALRDAWDELARHHAKARQFRTKRLSAKLALDVYAGIRAADDAPCLLIQAEVSPTSLFEVSGMRLNSYPGEIGPLLILTLEDLSRADLFTTVCADAIAAAESAVEEGLLRFLARLDAWRRFLREHRAGMSRNEAVGLIGELLVLERLLDLNRTMLPAWTAPDDSLHDFTLLGHALETKTTLGPSSSLRISSLDQLDSAGLRQLHLVHVRLVETPDGRNLGGLIADVAQRLPDESERYTFANSLLRRGLMPEDVAARSKPVVTSRVLATYEVGVAFPKLIRTSVPQAVQEAEYSLEIRALSAHSADVDAVFEKFVGGALK
jgi:hypothetical protein